MKLCLADELIRRGEPLLRDRIKPKGNPGSRAGTPLRGKDKSKKAKSEHISEPCKLSPERLKELGATIAKKKSLADVQLAAPKLQIGASL